MATMTRGKSEVNGKFFNKLFFSVFKNSQNVKIHTKHAQKNGKKEILYSNGQNMCAHNGRGIQKGKTKITFIYNKGVHNKEKCVACMSVIPLTWSTFRPKILTVIENGQTLVFGPNASSHCWSAGNFSPASSCGDDSIISCRGLFSIQKPRLCLKSSNRREENKWFKLNLKKELDRSVRNDH